MDSALASPAHPLGPGSSPVHPMATRNKARAAAALAQVMAARPAARGAGGHDGYDDDVGGEADIGLGAGATNGRYDGGRSPMNGAAGGGGGVKDKYFGFALPKAVNKFSPPFD
ncbi:hypothetical protein ABZP36_008937 [Zizania latifolia]